MILMCCDLPSLGSRYAFLRNPQDAILLTVLFQSRLFLLLPETDCLLYGNGQFAG